MAEDRLSLRHVTVVQQRRLIRSGWPRTPYEGWPATTPRWRDTISRSSQAPTRRSPARPSQALAPASTHRWHIGGPDPADPQRAEIETCRDPLPPGAGRLNTLGTFSPPP